MLRAPDGYLLILIFFPDFSFRTRFPPTLPKRIRRRPSRVSWASRSHASHNTLASALGLAHALAHTHTNWNVTGEYTHIRARALIHTRTNTRTVRSYTLAHTHSQTGCQNNRSVRFSAGHSHRLRRDTDAKTIDM